MPRSILEIVQSAAPKIGIPTPSVLMTDTSATGKELAAMANEIAKRFVRHHDWSLLKTEATYTGDGTTTGFNLPSDYVRMPKDQKIWSSRVLGPLLHVTSHDDWLGLQVRNYGAVSGAWTIIGGKVEFNPPLASGETAKFYYISNKVVAYGLANTQATFRADTDVFRLDDLAFELWLIWAWREAKGLSYAEDMATAETALAQAVSEDKGSRMLTQASRRSLRGEIAYNGIIVP